jgi:hypothetical protein
MQIRLWFIIMTGFATFSLHAQEYNRQITDPRFGTEELFGYCNREGLMRGEFGRHFNLEYTVEPDAEYLEKIRKIPSGYRITLVMGSWCSDSREQVPRFYRILDDAGIDSDIMQVICVDGYKSAGDIDLDHHRIEFVPTFIITRGGREIGRIIETPVTSLEEDFLSIISQAADSGQ